VTAPRQHLPTFYQPHLPESGAQVLLSDDAAHHARVRRLDRGDRVGLTDGAGLFATGVVDMLDRATCAVRVESLETREAPPELHVYAPVADRDRMLWLAEKVTEIGVASWRSVRFRHSASVSPRGEGQSFHAKLEARMVGALVQSNGAWLPRIEPDVAAADLVAPASALCIVPDAGGEPLAGVAGSRRGVHLLIGPEGGIEQDEMARLVSGGWRPARLGENTLRFETAALAAVAILQNG
jgi:16S rRNA (uracil1498-N3)-methyltransferase